MRLQDKVVLVTGAAGTIGREVCHVLAGEGARLALTDVSDRPLRELLDELADGAGKLWGAATDVADYKECQKLVDKVTEAIGAPQILVNVAGTFKFADFIDTSPADWSTMIAANLLTAMASCRAVLPGMLEARSGAIVNFASTAGEYGSIRPAAAYAAAKAGVIGLTKSLAREVSPLGVRVNAISPGPVDTPALQVLSDEGRAAASARTLVGRLGYPRDIAHGVLYLASDESAFVTGTVLQVNGGSLL